MELDPEKHTCPVCEGTGLAIGKLRGKKKFVCLNPASATADYGNIPTDSSGLCHAILEFRSGKLTWTTRRYNRDMAPREQYHHYELPALRFPPGSNQQRRELVTA